MMLEQSISGVGLVRLTGLAIMAFGFLGGLFTLVVLPFGCTFLSGLELLVSLFAFIIGGLVFLAGHVLVARARHLQSVQG